MRDEVTKAAKRLYPDIEAKDDMELVTLGAGTFKGKTEDFPAYMKKIRQSMTSGLGPSKAKESLAYDLEKLRKRLDAPLRSFGVRCHSLATVAMPLTLE